MSKRINGTGLGLVIAATIITVAIFVNLMSQPRQGNVPAPAPTPAPTPAIEKAEISDPPEAGSDNPLADLKFGYVPNPEATAAFVATLPAPTIVEAMPAAFQARGPPKDVFPYRAMLAAHEERFGTSFSVGRQGIGDCVSWGWAHGVSMHLAVLYQEGLTSEWWPVATEPIYGGSRVEARGVSRGGYSDGSYGSAAADWVSKWGILYRQKYDLVDLTTYSSSRAKDWGNFGCGGEGDAGRLDQLAKQYPVGGVTLVTNFDEAAEALRSGYFVPVCSSQGFASVRTEGGWANASGSWAHCMCFIAARHDPPGLLCINSWGTDWIRGPKYPDDQPEGSFWVAKATVDRMLAGRDSFAVSKLKGFPFKPLDHSDWATLIHIDSASIAKRRKAKRMAIEPILSQAL